MKNILNRISVGNKTELIENLKKFDIDILDEDGYVKDLYEVLEELSKVWSETDEMP